MTDTTPAAGSLPEAPPVERPPADRLALTLFIAAALHAVLILGVGFEAFERDKDAPTTQTLDIVVVQREHKPPAEEYDYLAETSQDGGGNTRERVRPRPQSVAQAPPPAASAPQQGARATLTRERSERKAKVHDRVRETRRAQPDARHTMERRKEILDLNQQINQSLLAYSQAPRQKFISARTREFKYANYMREWVAKVERVGDLNYPDEARRRRLSGSLIVDVALNADGTVRNITIIRPSGHKILDDAAVRIVRLAAPFAPFPEDIRRETDILHITRTWEFTSGHRLQGR